MKRSIVALLFFFSMGAVAGKPASNDIRRASSAPYIAGDSFRAIADHVYDETDRSLKAQEIRHRDVIFVKTDYLQEFFTTIHPYVNHKYILITHNSDYGAPGSFASYLDDTKLYKWFGQNPTIVGHPKFVPIPIGIANRMWPHGNVSIFDKALSSQSVIRNRIVGMNFTIGTKADVRQFVHNLFSQKSFCVDLSSKDLFTYLTNMKRAQFILCPVGNGLDCHRTWEALLMGAIPVMVHSQLDELLSGLPVLIVDNWTDITQELLRVKYAEIQEHYSLYSHEKKTFDYWYTLIQATRNSIP